MNKYEKIFEEFLKTTSYAPIKNITREYSKPIKGVKNRLHSLTDADDITWEFIYNEFFKYKDYEKSAHYILWILYTIELDKQKCLKGHLSGKISQNAEAIKAAISSSIKNKKNIFMTLNFNPNSLVLTPIKRNVLGMDTNVVFVVEGLNFQQNCFITQYINTMSASTLNSKLGHHFPLLFEVLANSNCLYSEIQFYNDDTFFEQFKTIDRNISNKKTTSGFSLKKYILGELVLFYKWIQTNLNKSSRESTFKKITPEVLKMPSLVKYLLSGYEIVNYSIYEEPPHGEKWLIQGHQISLHKTSEADKITKFDVSIIKNKYLKQWIKECFWFDTSHHINNRSKEYNTLISLLCSIDKKVCHNALPEITIDDILEYKAKCVGENCSDGAVSRKLGMVRFFLNYIEDKGYLSINELIYRLLSHHDSKNTNKYKVAYTKEEIKELLAAYKLSYESCKDSDRKLLYKLYYYIIAIQSVTEMRISTILNLKTDCLIKTLERNGQNEYKAVVYSKASRRDPDEYNITYYVKSLIDEVIQLTADLRKESTGVEKGYVFIYKRHNRRAISIVRQDGLSWYHKQVCKQYKIKQLQLGAIRNYYQQQVSEYVSSRGDDPMLIERLSKHGINVHIQYYDAIDIQDFCQKFHQVEIGSIALKGNIQKTSNAHAKSVVANGCGHCSSPKCALVGNLDCLMCNNFVATLDCIPQFEKEIEIIDKKILEEPLQHEKEFLINKKRLNVAYLAKLYKLEEENNANISNA